MGIQSRGFELTTEVLGSRAVNEAWSDDILSPRDESRGQRVGTDRSGAGLGRGNVQKVLQKEMR
jgi:hypothetical protein